MMMEKIKKLSYFEKWALFSHLVIDAFISASFIFWFFILISPCVNGTLFTIYLILFFIVYIPLLFRFSLSRSYFDILETQKTQK